MGDGDNPSGTTGVDDPFAEGDDPFGTADDTISTARYRASPDQSVGS